MPYKYRTNFVYLFRLKHQDIMATINFLYRSTKDEANLILRLLFRHDGKDNVLAVNTKYSVSKHYWTKQHDIKKPKELAVVNKQHEVIKNSIKLRNAFLRLLIALVLVLSINNGCKIKWIYTTIHQFHQNNFQMI